MKRKHAQAHTYAEKQNNSLHIVVIKTKKKKKMHMVHVTYILNCSMSNTKLKMYILAYTLPLIQ